MPDWQDNAQAIFDRELGVGCVFAYVREIENHGRIVEVLCSSDLRVHFGRLLANVPKEMHRAPPSILIDPNYATSLWCWQAWHVYDLINVAKAEVVASQVERTLLDLA